MANIVEINVTLDSMESNYQGKRNLIFKVRALSIDSLVTLLFYSYQDCNPLILILLLEEVSSHQHCHNQYKLYL